jgi:heavy metal sensor kinase
MKRHKFFHRLTFKLTLLHLTFFAAASLAVFFLIYFSLTTALRTRAEENLQNEIREFEALFNAKGLNSLEKEFINESRSNGSEAWFYLLLSPTHRILASSDLSPWKGKGGDLTPKLIDTLQEGEEAIKTEPKPGHEHKVRVAYKKIKGGCVLQVGNSLRDNDEILKRIGEIFVYGFLAMLSIGALLGWLVSRHAMSGVERVTETAIRIDRGDLSRRVPIGKEGQEIEDLARSFNNMLDRIQILVTDLEEVTNNIAHDLRSPLTRIRGVAESALSAEKSLESCQEMAGVVIEECDQFLGMINTMLAIAQTDSGLSRFSKTPLDVRDILRETVELFQPAAEDAGIAIGLKLPEHPLIVSGDKAALKRVMANLLDNAIKFSENGDRIKITAVVDTTKVIIEISDTGMGIEEKDLPHIFDRFYRGDKSRSAPGNGLGLSLALSIIRAHGGEIIANSIPEDGSTFSIYLLRESMPFL